MFLKRTARSGQSLLELILIICLVLAFLFLFKTVTVSLDGMLPQ